MDDIALVTGGARGIGREVCRQLVDRGLSVVLAARDVRAGGAAAEAVGAEFVALDVASPASIAAAAERMRDYGRLDVLVNNAAAFADWSETPSTAAPDRVEDVLRTNLLGPWRLIQALLPLLTARPGARIVNVSSGGGSHADPDFGLTTNGGAPASYGVSKAALNALTAALAEELAPRGVLVNAVCPGLTATAPGMEAMGARPVPEGAASVVWAATLPPDGPSGGFFRDGRPLGW